MAKHSLLKKISLGIASLALICPLALGSISNSTVANARKRSRTHRIYRHHRRTRRNSHKSYIRKCYRSYNYDLRHYGHASYKFGRKHNHNDYFRLKHSVRAYYYELSDESPVYNHIIGMKTLHKGAKVHAYYQGTEGMEWSVKARGLHTSSHVVASMTLTDANAKLI